MEKNKGTDAFKKTIKAYLDNKAATDNLFAQTYSKPNKSIDECCNFIIQEVQKSGCNGFADEEIFSMAVHYYDEDSITGIKPTTCQVVVNHAVQLTEEEKRELKSKAEREYQERVIKEMQEKMHQPKKAKKEEPQQQLSLF